MSVTVKFECNGCFAETKGTRPLSRQFVKTHVVHGGAWGHYETDTPQDVAPEGWVAFDDTIGACYCPKCMAEMNQD